MPRDPRPAAIRRCEQTNATVIRCEEQLDAARKAARRALTEAVEAGVSKTELARRLGTSESRVRQAVTRAGAE